MGVEEPVSFSSVVLDQGRVISRDFGICQLGLLLGSVAHQWHPPTHTHTAAQGPVNSPPPAKALRASWALPQ